MKTQILRSKVLSPQLKATQWEDTQAKCSWILLLMLPEGLHKMRILKKPVDDVFSDLELNWVEMNHPVVKYYIPTWLVRDKQLAGFFIYPCRSNRSLNRGLSASFPPPALPFLNFRVSKCAVRRTLCASKVPIDWFGGVGNCESVSRARVPASAAANVLREVNRRYIYYYVRIPRCRRSERERVEGTASKKRVKVKP